MLKKKESMSAEEIATADELCERLDWVLAPYFWRDVNPKLANPLTKMPKTV